MTFKKAKPGPLRRQAGMWICAGPREGLHPHNTNSRKRKGLLSG
ncbi:BgTH12-02501 [Blumeria graminis f. sp. triticale]|uniref:BgTH12-02501 n=1 Tax=Blumeria graminis f. sp. triticale TaxID=1689686 RepID=A0A9W4D0V5_BLUGR|nr:BgTH12-02501 [Blumeria graminis f. sp. triticale]